MKGPSAQRGMTTAEYAVGTVAVVTGVGAVIAVLVDPFMPMRVFRPVLEALFGFILRTFGIAG